MSNVRQRSLPVNLTLIKLVMTDYARGVSLVERKVCIDIDTDLVLDLNRDIL